MIMTLARPALIALLVVLASSLSPNAQAERTRMTAASSVRLRANPSDQSRVVATLPLGTDLVELQSGTRSLSETLDSANRAWVRVKTGDGREGWVLTGLTRTFTTSQRIEVIGDIFRRRVARDDDFRGRIELVDFLERQQSNPTDPNGAGLLALYRLQALQSVVKTIGGGFGPHVQTFEDANHSRTAPVIEADWKEIKAWLAAKSDFLLFDEPGGDWILRHDAILRIHDQHRASTAADGLAWLAATNGLGGECESDIECYLRSENLLLGEYLRRQPQGAHVDTALIRLAKSAVLYRQIVEQPKLFDPTVDCPRIKKPVESLRIAAAATSSVARDQTLAQLDDLVWRCR